MNKLRLLVFAAIIAVLCVITGCQPRPSQSQLDDAWGTIHIVQNQPIHIRLAFSTSDQNVVPLGTEQLRGAQLAARQFESIQGFSVALDTSDAACTIAGGVTAANETVQQARAVGLIGMTCSTSCVASAPILENARYVEISPSCGASELTSPVNHNDVFFATSYTSATEGSIGGEFAFKQFGARTVAIISYDNLETADAINAFETSYQDSGGAVTSVSYVTVGEKSFQTAIEEAGAHKPDLIFAPLLPDDAVRFITQIRSSDQKGIPVLGGRYYLSSWFILTAGDSSDNTYAVGPHIDTSESRALADFYKRIYGDEPTSSEYVFAYDAMRLLLEAIRRVAVIDTNNDLLIGRKALRDAVQQTASYPGISGKITCTAWGDCSASGDIMIARVRYGKWEPVFIP